MSADQKPDPNTTLIWETTRNYSTPIECKIKENLSDPHVLGIDEAGRGPVLGPMVYGVCYWPEARNAELSNLGFADSKQLTAKKRDELFDKVLKTHDAIGWKLRVLTAAEISGQQLSKLKNNLNALSHQTAIQLISGVLGNGVNLTKVYVDTVGDPGKYQDMLKSRFPNIDVTVAKKADSLYPVVSAASICAKVTRDRVLEAWRFSESVLQELVDKERERGKEKEGEGVNLVMGCGYPGDGKTVAWLQDHFNEMFGFPDLVRFDWSTAKLKIAKDGVGVEWDEPEDEKAKKKEKEKKESKSRSITEFFAVSSPSNSTGTSNSPKKKPKLSHPNAKRARRFIYFEDRGMQSVQSVDPNSQQRDKQHAYRLTVIYMARKRVEIQVSRSYEEEFNEICFQFGLELDDVVTEKVTVYADDGSSEDVEEVIYKIDVPANRYDLLCMEGIVRAVHVYKGLEQPPKFKCVVPDKDKIVKIAAAPEVLEVRPFIVSAVLRNITLSGRAYASFIDLQDKLHQNICRQRTLVAIGTHDLDKIEGPFTYEACMPQDIKFKALKQTEEHTAEELMKIYESDLKLGQYLHIIKDKPRYPVIYDKHRRVLSMPPIINGQLSAISTATKNVFIECTATDYTKAKIVLNIIIAMFSQYCEDPFTVEAVEVTDARGSVNNLPNMDCWDLPCDVTYINSCISPTLALTASDMVELLLKLQIESQVSNTSTNEIIVSVPPQRADILHACDIVEDVAIAYGYTKVKPTFPKANTSGKEQPLNKMSTAVRRVLANSGYTEVFTFALCSRDESFKMMGRPDNNTAVVISNPKTAEFQVCRTSLLTGVLKCISANKGHGLPLQIFEVSDIVVKDDEPVKQQGEGDETIVREDVGASNQRNVCVARADNVSGFQDVHGVLDFLMLQLGAKSSDYHLSPPPKGQTPRDTTFFEGRRAYVIYKGQEIGEIGWVHPRVLDAFDIRVPVTAFEVNLERVLE